jgi:hypothetical protein
MEGRIMVKGLFEPVRGDHRDKLNLWLPMIKVSLSDSIDPNTSNVIDENVLAIVDTGSCSCCIDQTYAARRNTFYDTGQRVPITGATGTTNVPVYNLQIIVEGHILQMYCPSIPLRSADNPCDLLFGMDAIRFFELSANRSHNLLTLSWIQQ